MAPRADASRRTVIGTLLSERLLDVVVIVVLFVVVGYGVLGEVGAGRARGDRRRSPLVGLVGAVIAFRLLRRNERLASAIGPMLDLDPQSC